jgi:hypothetical protein
MNTPKFTALLAVIILLSCTSSNVLSHRRKKYFKEGSEFYVYRYGPLADSLFTLSQWVRFDNPKSIDEEYVEGITLQILDTTAAKQKVVLNLATDTTIVKAYYGLQNFMSYLNPKVYRPNGEITILKWTREEIAVKEDIIVKHNDLKKPIIFKGKRTFVRNYDMEKPLQGR